MSHDIEGEKKLFFALNLDNYPGKNISDFASRHFD
jgi:hypothetical protein